MDQKSLVALEKIDIEIARLEKSKKTFPVEVAEMEEKISASKEVLGKATAKVENCDREKTHAQNELELNKQELSKSHEKLNAVKTDREYDAMLLEISERKSMIERAQKKIKKCTDDMVKFTEKLEEAQASFDEISGDLQPQVDDLKEKISTIDADVAKVQEDRPAALEIVDPKFVKLYETIQNKRKNGRALSTLNKDSLICGYCYKYLSPQDLKKAKAAEGVEVCENCGSIFVWEQ